ncbi:MAG: hypothetical protein GW763_06480 [Paraglaciecola sp.]|nr:hypothetical protein [Paraglaciecola sp.]NCT47630.1 hypothetical protein [Paraglaciecola sp.]
MQVSGIHALRLMMMSCILLLCGCSSTGSSDATPASNNKVLATPTSNLQFNQMFTDALNNGDSRTLHTHIDVLTIATQLRSKDSVQFINPLATAKNAAELKTQMVAGLVAISQSSSWTYLYSEALSDKILASYYRINTEDSYNYLTFFQDAESYKIYDFHPVALQFSALDFLVQFGQLFSRYKGTTDGLALEQIITNLNQGKIDVVVSNYQALPSKVAAEPALNDFLLRKIQQLPEAQGQTLRTSLLKSAEARGITSLVFEADYIQQDNFKQAISIVQTLPAFARQDSKMQSELAILHAYDRDFTRAILYGRQAVMQDPSDEEAFFVLFQVALLAKDFTLSIAVLDVLVAKFDYRMEPSVIQEFDESSDFMRSAEYQQWQQKRLAS